MVRASGSTSWPGCSRHGDFIVKICENWWWQGRPTSKYLNSVVLLQENQGKWPYLGPTDIKLENIQQTILLTNTCHWPASKYLNSVVLLQEIQGKWPYLGATDIKLENISHKYQYLLKNIMNFTYEHGQWRYGSQNAKEAWRKWREMRMRDLRNHPTSPDFTRAPSSVDGDPVSRHWRP